MRDGVAAVGLVLAVWLAAYGLVSVITDLTGIWPGCA